MTQLAVPTLPSARARQSERQPLSPLAAEQVEISFDTNGQNIYDLRGTVVFAVICRMRASLRYGYRVAGNPPRASPRPASC